MKIVLYKNNSDKNTISKRLSLVGEINGTLKSPSSIVDPSITIRNNFDFNYCYIENFKRYYFVKEMTLMNNDLMTIDLHCDVLMSFKDQLLKCKGVILRQENLYNLYLEDSLMKKQTPSQIQYKRFDKELSIEPNYVITMLGATDTGGEQ